MKRAYFVFVLFLLADVNSNIYAQNKVTKLLVAEYRIDTPQVGRYSYLVSYNFVDGIFTSKDTIVGIKPIITDKRHKIYKRKYLIFRSGNVIDLAEKKLIITGDYDQYVETIGDTIIFCRNHTSNEKIYFTLDLRSKKYDSIPKKSWYRPRYESSSPDNKYFLTINTAQTPYQIILNDHDGGKRMVVEDAKTGAIVNGQLPDIETVWLNNNSFLYVVHHRKISKDKISFNKVDLRCYNIKNGKDTLYCSIDSSELGFMNGYFEKNGIDQLIYRASSGNYYIVDTIGHRLLPYITFVLNEAFSYSRTMEWAGKANNSIYKNGSKIGEIWSLPPIAAENAVAVEYGEKSSNLDYSKGIKVWTTEKKDWITFDISWINSIIGWID